MNWYVLACIASVWSGQFSPLSQDVRLSKAILLPTVSCLAPLHPGTNPNSSGKGKQAEKALVGFRLASTMRDWSAPVMGDRRLLDPASLEPLARAITVRVTAGKNSGSGILIQRRGMLYSVLTNHHVLNAGAPYRIQTPDGRVYPARLLSGREFKREDYFLGNDLEIMQFSSPRTYAIASLNPQATLSQGEEVFAAGFPHEHTTASEAFVVVNGQISFVLQHAFVGGYRIGYNTFIPQGMSGGPLLNRQGEVVGINGLHAYPLWGNPYIFEDGSVPQPQIQAAIARSSWAIPIVTFICLAPPTQMSLAVPLKRQEICNPG